MTELITAPVRLATGLPHAISNSISGIFREDIASNPSTGKLEDSTLYDLASPNLDLCTLIYYYTELRSSTKLKLKAFADRKTLSYEYVQAPSDIEILYEAYLHVEKCRAALEIALSPSSAIADYKSSLKGIEDLKERFKITSGDMQVLHQYFAILTNEPKSLTDVKRDLCLFSSYLDPQFVLAFGGKDFNVVAVEDLVDLDDTAYIYKMDDDFVTTSLNPLTALNNLGAELVYAIVISDKFKTVSVVFRGSVNAADWMTNLDLNSTECLFPGFTDARGMASIKQTSFGKVHAGFYEYLCKETKMGRDGSKMSKVEQIVGILKSLVGDNGEKEGYRVCITGHSLGGALSTLMGARCAAFGEFKTPVINISVASPFVGDQGFRDSFYKMEKSRHIKHLRLSNYEDLVPLVPATTYPLPDFHTYKQTGWNVKLFNKSLIHPYFTKSYPKEGDVVNEVVNAVNSNLLNGFNINMLNHLTPEYRKRLTAAKDELKEYSLSDLYNSTEWTGWEYDEPLEEPVEKSVEKTLVKEPIEEPVDPEVAGAI